MDYTTLLSIPKGAAVCYSGFREGQRPGDVYPTYEQVKEDLTIVQNHWRYIRLYSCDQHAHTCLLYTSPSPRDRQKSRMPSSA